MRGDTHTRRGFTLLELLVALALSGLILLGARLMLEGVADDAGRIAAAARAADREANAERALRQLFARLDLGGSPDAGFGGDERTMRFSTWCSVPAGWLERCRVTLGVETAEGGPSGGSLQLVARFSNGEVLVLRPALRAATLRYLNDAAGGYSWFRGWGDGITAPAAVGIIADGDTLIVRIGERG